MSEQEKNEIVNLLKSIKNNDQSKNLYDHLQALFDTKLTMQDDEKFLDLFEDISTRIKADGFYISQEDKKQKIRTYLEYFIKANAGKKTLLEPLVKREGDDVTPITSVGFVPDYYSLFQNLEWCGISLSDKESYLLTNSLRTLASEKSLPSVTFWGKIFGKNKDYYIVETAAVEGGNTDGKEPDPEQEARGSGLNKNSYFVANDLTGPWKELDDVKPSTLRAARKIKVVFSGDLNKPIVSNPWFNGKESDYLRCQIARITSHITIIPNVGNYKVSEGREIEGPIEEVKAPNVNDCINIKNWVHFLPSILKEGRLTHLDRDPGDKDPEEFKKEIIAKDPFEPRLKPISNDICVKCPIPNISIPAWKLTYCYDDKIYTNPNVIINPEDEESLKKDTSISTTIVHLRSTIWPGAQIIRLKNQNHYLYFGWGNKYNDDILEDKFVFQNFPKIESENVDLPIGEEPVILPEVIDKDANMS